MLSPSPSNAAVRAFQPSAFPDKPHDAPAVVAQPRIVLPVAAFQQDNRSRSICNAFSRAVRDLSWHGVEPSPQVIKEALEVTFHKMAGVGRHEVMQSLVKGGLEAPREAMPKGFEAYAVNPSERSVPTGAFGRALAGVSGLVRNVLTPAPGYHPSALVCAPG